MPEEGEPGDEDGGEDGGERGTEGDGDDKDGVADDDNRYRFECSD